MWQQFHAFVARSKLAIMAAADNLATSSSSSSSSNDGGGGCGGTDKEGPYGLVLDLHGQSHDLRHQIGYMLRGGDLRRPDADLDADTTLRDKCSLRASLGTSRGTPRGISLSALVRGSHSLGALLEARGQACVPSPGSPDPGKVVYFSGGYNTAVHGSSAMKHGVVAPLTAAHTPRDRFVALQIESGRECRGGPAAMGAFAADLAASLRVWCAMHAAPLS